MPRFQDNNPEAPRNRALVFYLAARKVVDPGDTIKPADFRKAIMRTQPIDTRQHCYRLMDAMEDWGFIDVVRKEGKMVSVSLCEDGLVAFPHLQGWAG